MIHSLLLPALLGLSLSLIFMLPPFRQVECAMSLDLPRNMGGILLQEYPPSQREIDVLAKDTRFAKARCGIPRPEERSFITGEVPMDVADLSIVLSGYDLANSIHRPERCMPAQGHRIHSSESSELELGNGRKLPITRLLSKQTIERGTPEKPLTTHLDALTYYFFVGNSAITASHTERTVLDIRDRVLAGQAQRWAFVSASIAYHDPESGRPNEYSLPDRARADANIRALLASLAEERINWEQVRG